MEIPPPRPGQVVRYAYLWADEHRRGQEEGSKERPCAIALAITGAHGELKVAVVPITHSPPANEFDAIEMPPRIKARLGLDVERSWVVLTEVNEFVWPGPDLRPVPHAGFIYGQLPDKFFRRIQEGVIEAVKRRRMQQVPRTE